MAKEDGSDITPPSGIEGGIHIWMLFGDAEGKERLAWWLRSGRPLSQKDRDLLADFIEGKIKRPGKGKPPLAHHLNNAHKLALHAAALEVEEVATGRRRGARDAAIEAAVKKYGPQDNQPDSFEERLRELLRRSKERRGPPGWA
jgi:hypothetical protein